MRETDADDIVFDEPPAAAAQGATVLRDALTTMPGTPGVYRMLDAKGDALYVGKARNLKRRVSQYLQFHRMPHRLLRMVAETRKMEIVSTHTEVEALLLESNLIKRLKPRFNVLLRDDKSFPYIALIEDHDFPQVTKHRGSRDRKGSYYGPFASAGSVNQTLTAMQRAFLLRSCNDSIFTTRTRPCLLYQIKRCSAPCVGRIGKADYATLIGEAKAFLDGRSRDAQEKIAAKMQAASDAMDFETAAMYRDRIRALTAVQARQDINVDDLGDCDVIALASEGGQTCLQVFFFRGGRNYGNRAYFPRHDKSQDEADIVQAFLGQFYDDKPPPPLLALSHEPPERDLIEEALTAKAGRRVRILVPERGTKRKPVEHALANAREALARRMAETGAQAKLLAGVAEVFGLDAPPKRIEVYDNSHIQGAHAIGGMVVAGPEGFIKNQYRKFNIKGDGKSDVAAGGDDFAMMREVFERRFGRALREDPDRSGGTWPDLVLIDGGEGQLNAAIGVLTELGIDDLNLVGVAKGPDRNAGRERFFVPGRAPFQLEPRDPVLYYLQRLRDEVHRFAIGSHRTRRAGAIQRSALDDIPGIGPRRKKALLLHFGSSAAVKRAGLADLAAVPGVGPDAAKKIYDHFHSGG
ncbi:MAG: excinuclease ABC subunit UvrC [Alphaproteobacteria bacterium]|nr:excinuclease ABC subunit UvrC [Alphaproteobacteria bacterium]